MSIIGRKTRSIENIANQARRTLVSASAEPSQQRESTTDVIGDIIFSDAILDSEIGHAHLVLSGGHIIFVPQNGVINFKNLPEEFRIQAGNNYNEYSISRTDQKKKNQRSKIQIGGNVSLISADANASYERETNDENLRTVVRQASVTGGSLRLSAQRLPDSGFKLTILPAQGTQIDDEYLIGVIHSGLLFTLEGIDRSKDATVNLYFQALPKHVKVIDGTGAWKSDLGTTKRQLIARLTEKLLSANDWLIFNFILPKKPF